MGIDLNKVFKEPVDVILSEPQFFVLPVIPALLYLIGDIINGAIGSIFNLLGMILEIMVDGALVYMAYRLLKTGSTDYWEGLTIAQERLVDLLIAAVIIGIGAFIGFLLFVIPGLIWLMLVVFSIPILIIENKDAVTSIKESINLTLQYGSDVLVYVIILVLIVFAVQWILGLIPYIGNFIATIVVSPYVAVSLTMAYEQLKEESGEALEF
ncbi:hypothetical protein [Thermococcus sp.]